MTSVVADDGPSGEDDGDDFDDAELTERIEQLTESPTQGPDLAGSGGDLGWLRLERSDRQRAVAALVEGLRQLQPAAVGSAVPLRALTDVPAGPPTIQERAQAALRRALAEAGACAAAHGVPLADLVTYSADRSAALRRSVPAESQR
jgi:hypothetical protein